MPSTIFSRDFLQHLFESLPCPVIIFDRSGKILLQNLESRKNRKLVRFESFLAIVHPDERPGSYDKWLETFKDLRPHEGELRLLGDNGTYIWHRQSMVILNEFIVAVFHDVHEYKLRDSIPV